MNTVPTTATPGITNNTLPLGLRNNNPLNIRVSSNAWVGKISSPNGFENFSDIKYGIRAGIKNLQTYYNRDSLRTVSKIINKWAPPSENDTNNYVNYVSSSMGVGKDSLLPYNKETFASLFLAMSEMELGKKHGIPTSQVLAVISEFKLF